MITMLVNLVNPLMPFVLGWPNYILRRRKMEKTAIIQEYVLQWLVLLIILFLFIICD